MAQTLLSLGASFELHDNEGNTPLHYAAAWGKIDIVRILIQQGANAFVKNNSGYAPSDHAYSDKVVQEIQNEVRGVIEATKRARSAKASRKALSALELGHDPDDEDAVQENSLTSRSGKMLPALPRFLSQSLGVTVASGSPGAKKLGMSVGSGAVPPLPLKLLSSGLPVPSTPTLASSTGARLTYNTMETPPQHKLPMDIPPSPMPPGSGTASATSGNEHGKAVARMYARDHNAQSGFQASAAYKHLVGSATSATASPERRPPLATTGSSTASSSSHARRERSSSSDILSGAASSSSSSNASSAGGLRSPGSSTTEGSPFWSSSTARNLPPVPPIPAPHLQHTLAYLNATSIPLPTSPLPGTPTQSSTGLKSSATSFFAARLKRSGSGGSASPSLISLATSNVGIGTAPASALEPSFFPREGVRDGSASAALPALPREMDTAPPLPAKKSSTHAFAAGFGMLKQHASIADLRSQAKKGAEGGAAGVAAPVPAATNGPQSVYTPALHKSGFHLGRSRSRAGT